MHGKPTRLASPVGMVAGGGGWGGVGCPVMCMEGGRRRALLGWAWGVEGG